MRKSILLFIIFSLLAASLCSENGLEYLDLEDSGCLETETESESLTREVCNKRKAATSGFDCCYFEIEVSGAKTNSCVGAKKSKAGDIVDAYEDADAGKVSIECEASMMKYFALLALVSLFLF